VPVTQKDLTNFLADLGLATIEHTEKTYLGHLIAVHRDLQAWGCAEDVCLGGMFHSIYGTQQFQGFTLPLERRGEVQALIGERAEQLGYWNCAMYRPVFDASAIRGEPPHRYQDRISGEEIELSSADFADLCRIHLCDWLEQVPRCQDWGHRREAYRAMADHLGGVALESYERVFAAETS